MKKTNKRSVPYQGLVDERLKNPRYAIEFLNSVLDEQDPDLLLLALRDVAKIHGFSQLAQNSGLGRESLYKALSKGKNPRIGTILDVVSALGFKFRLEAKRKALKAA